MKDSKIPVAVLTFLAAQLGGAIWWASQTSAKLDLVVGDQHMKLVKENRRYIQEVIIPSYEINDNWDNPHHNNWLKSGGWKD